MKAHAKRLMIIAQLAMAVPLAACSAVSFTHANSAKGQSVTNAEIQPNNTVVLTYPNGSACIDTNPGESTVCTARDK